MTDNYNILIRKLDKFIRKYYSNLLIKGILYFISISFLFFIIVNIFEYYAHLGIIARTILFYSFLTINSLVLLKLIIIPLFNLYKIGKIISHEKAAEIIGQHFVDIQDKLLNTLQLHENLDNNIKNDLLLAGIDQKISKLKPFTFTQAIDFSKNKKYLKYVLPPVFILILVLFISPKVITEPTQRIIKHHEYFEKVKPFEIAILNEKLEVVQQDDFILDVKINGDIVPESVFINLQNTKHKLIKLSPTHFQYIFNNVQNNIDFFLSSNDVTTLEYSLIVLPKPILLNFETEIIYPKYINKPNEILNNTGDLIIPIGSDVNWKFFTQDVSRISVRFADNLMFLDKKSSNVFSCSKTFFKSQSYSVSTENDFIINPDSLIFAISVIPDNYPTIIIEEFHDSIYEKRLYFKGFIKDDYGFNRLDFAYAFLINSDSLNKINSIHNIPIAKNIDNYEFYHFFDLDNLNISPGDEVEYYFEIWDNDAINGSKSTRSQKMIFIAPSLEEIEKSTEQNNKKIKDQLKETIDQTKSLQKEIDELSKKLVDKKSLNWQDKEQIRDLLKKQNTIKNNIEKINEINLEKNINQQQYRQFDEEIVKKQQELSELFEKIMTDEMKEMFEELQKLLDEVDKNKVNDMLEQMQLSNEDIKDQLDRNLELFKQLEFEQKLSETIEKLEKLAEEQKGLSEKTEDRKNDIEELKTDQDKIDKKFDDFQKDMDELNLMNNDLEEPNKLNDTEKEEEKIQEELENSKNSLEKNKRKKASASQKSASKKMKELSKSLSEMQMEMNMEQTSEDINSLREILENILQLSFDQEDLIFEFNSTQVADPNFLKLIQKQNRLKDDLNMVEDSLFALSKRQMKIKPFITNEINLIEKNFEKAIEKLNNRRVESAASSQQYILTSLNNLSLLLDEILKQMQQNSQNQCSGEGNPSGKPGGGKPSAKSLRKMQEQLNQQIQQLKEGMSSPGKTGQKPGEKSISEQLARLAAEQAAIRNQMQQYAEELKREGTQGGGELNKTLKDMEQTETDLVNKMISLQTLKRQEEILTRLLKSEKAEREREKEERRESNEAKKQDYSNPSDFLKYQKLKNKDIELLRKTSLSLKSFYKKKVSGYLHNIEN
ncbi:MAG: hypothetical protein JEY97_14080 [Bacteroidales bacterium]|nr:hypothetical protein [Bacteroidales bacterium]